MGLALLGCRLVSLPFASFTLLMVVILDSVCALVTVIY